MSAAQRFASDLRGGGITPEKAASIFAERDLSYRPDCVKAWVEGRVIPGLNVRFMMLVRLESSPEDREYYSRIFSRHGPEECWPLVEKLCSAVRSGNLAEVQASLDGGVVIDAWDKDKGCAIGYSAKGEHPEITELLMDYGASPMAFVDGTGTAWKQALLYGSAAQVRLFLNNRVSLSMTDLDGRGVLELAAQNHRQDTEVLRAVFEASRAAPISLNRPLSLAASAGNLPMMKQCLALGASVHFRDQHKRTALMAAAEAGAAEASQVLLDFGAEIGPVDNNDRTALHHAVLGRNPLVIEILLGAGADRKAVDAEGRTAIDLASGTAMEAALMDIPGNRSGPSWYRAGAKPIHFSYSKAFGLGFDPGNLDRPILYGGDYNGMMPAVAEYFLRDTSIQEELGKNGMMWFIVFARKLANKEHFTLEEMLSAAEANGCMLRSERG